MWAIRRRSKTRFTLPKRIWTRLGRPAKSKRLWRTRVTTARIVFNVYSASHRGEPTFQNRNARYLASGRTSRRRTSRPIVATVAIHLANEVVSYNATAASRLNAVSLTLATQAARGAHGFAVWRKSRSDT